MLYTLVKGTIAITEVEEDEKEKEIIFENRTHLLIA